MVSVAVIASKYRIFLRLKGSLADPSAIEEKCVREHLSDTGMTIEEAKQAGTDNRAFEECVERFAGERHEESFNKAEEFFHEVAPRDIAWDMPDEVRKCLEEHTDGTGDRSESMDVLQKCMEKFAGEHGVSSFMEGPESMPMDMERFDGHQPMQLRPIDDETHEFRLEFDRENMPSPGEQMKGDFENESMKMEFDRFRVEPDQFMQHFHEPAEAPLGEQRHFDAAGTNLQDIQMERTDVMPHTLKFDGNQSFGPSPMWVLNSVAGLLLGL